MSALAVRSLLYVPADRPTWVAKAWAAGADAVILDLEDSVTADRKDQARAGAVEAITTRGAANGGSLWVRVTPDNLETDLSAVIRPGLDGVVVPKAEPPLVRVVAARLAGLESERDLAPGSLGLLAIIETAVGVQRLPELAALPRVTRLSLGEADLAGELGILPDAERSQMLPLRTSLVVASAAARLQPPVGPVHTALGDLDGLRVTTESLLRQGYRARTAVHPSQVQVINDVFSPTAAEVEHARGVLASYEASVERGAGAVRGPDGTMLDAATVRSAREVLARTR